MKKIKIFNTIMSVLILLGAVMFLLSSAFKILGNYIVVKGVASALFVATGVVNLIYMLKNKSANKAFSILLVTGLVFAFLGDVLLEIHFITGAALFALGHVFFFISYLFLNKFRWQDLICAGIIFLVALSIILFVPIFEFEGVYKIVCIAYALIISLMLGKAVSNYLKDKSKQNLIILIGSALFFFSDAMLLFSVFGGLRICVVFCLLTYYPAEFMLAYSILHSKK